MAASCHRHGLHPFAYLRDVVDRLAAGPLEGDALAALLQQTKLPLVASGGVGAIQDLLRLARVTVGERRLAGVIVGKALVEGRFSVEEGIAACAASV